MDNWLHISEQTQHQLQRLANIKNRRTLYEVILTNGTIQYRVGYGKRGKAAVHRLTRANWDDILRITKGQIPFVTTEAKPFHGNEWRVLQTARTQRDAILAGELVWVGSEALKGN